MKFDVVTFGSGVVDVFVSTKQSGKRIEYKTGSKILIDDLKFDVGGGATNSAVAFSRLGLKTGCICKVGDDNNGDDVLKVLKKEGVRFLGRRVKGKTGYSVILDSKDKNRTILTFKGPGNDIGFSDVKRFGAKWLYFSSVLGKSFKTQVKLARKMKKKGAKVVFNPSEYLIKDLDVRELLKLSDVVVLNKEEFDLVRRKYGRSLLEICLGIIVVTDKNKEIICYGQMTGRGSRVEGRGIFRIKPNKVKVVERTGAGDAFASGFVAGQIVGMSIKDSLKLGLKESENVIRYFGAKNRLLRRRLK